MLILCFIGALLGMFSLGYSMNNKSTNELDVFQSILLVVNLFVVLEYIFSK